MNKTCTTLLAAAGVTLAMGHMAFANDHMPAVSLYHGHFEIGFTPTGVLGDCDPTPPAHVPPGFHRALVRGTFEKLHGVCDDQSNRPCAGRLVVVTERCFADDVVYDVFPDDPSTAESELVSVEYATTRARICYDETGEGHCDAVDQVASGAGFNQIQGSPRGPLIVNTTDADPLTNDVTGTTADVLHITQSSRFLLDGAPVRVPRGARFGRQLFRANDACLVQNVCPTVGTYMSQ